MQNDQTPTEGNHSANQETKAALDDATYSAIHLGMEEQMLTYRRKNFAVEVTPPRKPGGEIRLTVTTNGTQAHSLNFLTEEIQRVIDALVPFLPNAKRIRATCSDAVSDTPTTDAVWAIHQDFPHDEEGDPWLLCAKLERALNKFMAVTETSNEGITQMATIEERLKSYDRVRAMRDESHEIIPPNVESIHPESNPADHE